MSGMTANSHSEHALRQAVLKIHSRCNLKCDYCYVYEMADQRWRGRPKVMSMPTVRQAAYRIVEHAAGHNIPEVDVILHGGEPLLAGPRALSERIITLRSIIQPTAVANLHLQTNGTLLNRELLKILSEHDVSIGVSLDGARLDNDRHRTDLSGRGTFERVSNSLRLLGQPDVRHLFGGLLATIDLRNDPIETYRALLEFGPPNVDFLLPHRNWETLPPEQKAAGTPYADWLIEIFDYWYDTGRKLSGIRMFEEILHLLLGGSSSVEGWGLSPTGVVVVETNGDIESSDFLSSAYEGAAATGLNVSRNSFDAALQAPQFIAQQNTWAALSDTCRSCGMVLVCGGGMYAHRYRNGHFRNPSAYCLDLFRLIDHVHHRLATDLRRLAYDH